MLLLFSTQVKYNNHHLYYFSFFNSVDRRNSIKNYIDCFCNILNIQIFISTNNPMHSSLFCEDSKFNSFSEPQTDSPRSRWRAVIIFFVVKGPAADATDAPQP
jgi:hypothetical protein